MVGIWDGVAHMCAGHPHPQTCWIRFSSILLLPDSPGSLWHCFPSFFLVELFMDRNLVELLKQFKDMTIQRLGKLHLFASNHTGNGGGGQDHS